jgi:hypothetical protein
MPSLKPQRKAAGKSTPVGNKPDKQALRKTAKKASTPKGDLAPERIAAILKALDEAYPDAVCALTHRTPWEPAGGHYLVSAVYGCAGEYGDTGAVPALPHSAGDGEGLAA